MSMMVSFVLSFFPRDVLDEILNLIESVSEDFPSYSWFATEKEYKLYQSLVKKYDIFSLKTKPLYSTLDMHSIHCYE